MNSDCEDERELRQILSNLPWYYRIQLFLKIMVIVLRRNPVSWLWAIVTISLIYLTIEYPLHAAGLCIGAAFMLFVAPLAERVMHKQQF